jgi:hypothetical protein
MTPKRKTFLLVGTKKEVHFNVTKKQYDDAVKAFIEKYKCNCFSQEITNEEGIEMKLSNERLTKETTTDK